MCTLLQSTLDKVSLEVPKVIKVAMDSAKRKDVIGRAAVLGCGSSIGGGALSMVHPPGSERRMLHCAPYKTIMRGDSRSYKNRHGARDRDAEAKFQ